MNPTCGKCGRDDVRIYRWYGSFRRSEDDRCNACLDSTDWMVPCVLDEHGNAWGYTSVPPDACDRFYDLPEASPLGPTWRSGWVPPDLAQHLTDLRLAVARVIDEMAHGPLRDVLVRALRPAHLGEPAGEEVGGG